VAAAEAIDELERIFVRQYQDHLEVLKQDPPSS
jgi:hypothetical protein